MKMRRLDVMALICPVYGVSLVQESPMTFAKSSNHNPKIIIYLKYRVMLPNIRQE
jgi:hypothetical protein